jgi:peptide deformylase
MRTDDRRKGLRLSHCALPEMKARLALLNTAISSLQHYQGHSEEDLRDGIGIAAAAAGVRLRPFLVACRDNDRAKKAS